MARLDFDFHDAPARLNWAGWTIALAGAVALGWSVLAWQAARDATAGLDLQIGELQSARPVNVSRQTPKNDPADATRARIAAELAYSWQPAFDALASAQDASIALVALEASQAKSRLRLTAEARTLEDTLAWLARLQAQAGVRQAELLQHEVRTDSDERPVRVVVQVELAS